MNRDIWVTGANGFIGRHLSRQLNADGNRVCGLGFRHCETGLDDPEWLDWELGEIDHGLLSRLAERQALPETLFHLAGGSSVGLSFEDPWADFRATVLSLASVIDWVRTQSPKTRIIFVSSAAVYGSGHSGPISEGDGGIPFSPYGTHKKVAETMLEGANANFGLDCFTVRPFSVYGPGLRKQLLWDCCKKLSAEPRVLEMSGTGEEQRDWLYVGDLVKILAKAAEPVSGSPRVINAGSGRSKSVREVVKMLVKAYGQEALPITFTGRSRPGDPASLWANISKMKTLNAPPTVPLYDGIVEYVNWYKSL